jgi:hypothetical protein
MHAILYNGVHVAVGHEGDAATTVWDAKNDAEHDDDATAMQLCGHLADDAAAAVHEDDGYAVPIHVGRNDPVDLRPAALFRWCLLPTALLGAWVLERCLTCTPVCTKVHMPSHVTQ